MSLHQREEALLRVVSRLKAGQRVFLVSDDAPYLDASELAIETGVISDIPATDEKIEIRHDDGEKYVCFLNLRYGKDLYLGAIEEGANICYWVFLSEEELWCWWEWFVLTNALNIRRVSSGNDMEDNPTQINLRYARLLYDVLINDNLNYQSMDCTGCDFSDAADNAICAECVRKKATADHWQCLKRKNQKCPLVMDDLRDVESSGDESCGGPYLY